MKSKVIATKAVYILILLISFNGLKGECAYPDSADLRNIDLNEPYKYEGENEMDFREGTANKIQMTSLAIGGTGVLFTKVNNQLGVMTGGRGSATFNNRYTFGGVGWGTPKGIETLSKTDTLEFFKFGYGGLEFGYVLYEGEKVKFGTNLLTACGIGFEETHPKSKGEVKMFPVFEPSIYSQIALGKLLKLDIGLTYRFITGSKFPNITNQQLSGPSIYIAFLVGTCNCN